MTPKEYESLRNELTDLLYQAVHLPISEDKRLTLDRIRRRTLENQFNIVLVGEFQGGKSTTFDTLCDGRELSPTGSGIKTSGCIVSAQNIADANEPETAFVQWRNSEELIAGFSDLLIPHLQGLDEKRFDKVSALELGKVLKLDDPTDRKLMKQAADEEWAVWEKDKSKYDPDQKGYLDILRIAGIVSHYYADERLTGLRQQQQFRPEEIGNLIVFPQDWETRWMDKNPAKFRLEEVMFVFIKSIHLRLHCDNLARLGCVTIDCPGLFASRWDTDVARSAMFDSDAILYLFDGSRTMKLSDLKALQFVRNNSMEYKLFYGCNMRGHSLENSKRILQATATMLNNSGFQVKEDDISLFHALLALRAVQSKRFLGNKLDRLTAEKLSGGKEPLTENVKKRLHKDIQRQIALLDIDDNYSGIEETSVQSARKASGVDRLLDIVESTVVRKKAKKILINTGSQMAADCLLEVEGTLQSRENAACEKEKEFKQQVESAHENLKNFEKESGKIINRLRQIIQSCSRTMAENFLDIVNNHRDRFLSGTAKELYQIIKETGWREQISDVHKNKLSAKLQEKIQDFLKESSMEWITSIKDMKNEVYHRELVSQILYVSDELNRLWKQKAGNSDDTTSVDRKVFDFIHNLF